MKLSFRVIFSLLFFLPSPCLGTFSPEDVLVISNAAMKESIYLGRYYAKKRGISEESIVELDLPTSELITRDEFNNRILFPLKKEFDKRPDLLSKRVYVLIYGTPLSIANNSIPGDASEMQARLTNARMENQDKLKNAISKLQRIELSITGSKEPALFSIEEPGSPGLLLGNIQKLIAYTASGNHKEKESYLAVIRDTVVSLYSYQGKLLLTHPDKKEERARYQSKMNEIYSLSNPGSLASLEAYLSKVNEIYGVVGVLQRIPALSDELFGKDTGASVDSELGIFWLLPGGAPLSSRVPNPLYMHNETLKEPGFPFPLVGRLDGPNPGIVRRMIDASIAVEEGQTLSGNFLIDAQGVPWDQRDEFGEWDKDLTTLARNPPSGNRFTIEYDGRPEIAGKTEKIALYAGWYQVRQYQDSYTFTKGAIGYHIASSEAMSVRDPEEKGWCKNLLERGVIATIGAVDEPYLDSFPKPTDFFKLLLSGKYQLGEVYYLTTKYLSWRLVLFGDPLYQPISQKTALTELGYTERDLKKLPVNPSEILLSPAVHARKIKAKINQK